MNAMTLGVRNAPAEPIAMSTAESEISSLSVEEDVLTLDSVGLEFGGRLENVSLAWRIAGRRNAPLVAVLGGISAGRTVFATAAAEKGWWQEVAGPGRALDADAFRILGIDFLGGSGQSTGPQNGQIDFPSVSAYDQAALLGKLVERLQIGRLHAVVGASYGGMVALAFAERHPALTERIVAISAADRPHPMATAWRSVQRATVKALLARGAGAEGLKLARALAMATYRSPQEFKQRFDGEPKLTARGAVFPVEEYLFARGESYSQSYVPEAFICLSESIDLHRVDASLIKTPTTLVAVREDQLAPLADMQALYERLGGQKELIELSSLYGHDAFLKESVALRRVFGRAL